MRALLIVDMLKDFVYEWGALKVEGAKDIVPFIQKVAEEFRKSKEPIVYLCDSHLSDDPEFKIWPAHCVQGTEGADVIDELKPERKDFVVKKTTYSGFFGTNLHELLQNLKVDELVIVGVAMNICVHYTAVDARMLGYRVTVPLKGVKGITAEDEAYMAKQFKYVLNIDVVE